MIDNWIEKDKCTGCSACANVCPKRAITMDADEYGFIHPHISDECIDCGLCKRVCERRMSKGYFEIKPDIYAAWSKDNNLRFCSTSGGVVTEIAKYVINNNGVVYGASYDSDNSVKHISVDTIEKIELIRQSKYLQSKIELSFLSVKNDLIAGKNVLFCGSPCQISGLYAFLGKDYDNLLTVDFVCRGVNSPKAYNSWIKEIESSRGKTVKRVWFKYKEKGWKNSPKCSRIDYSDGTYEVFYGKDNLYMAAYLGPNLFIRPSCGQCDYKYFPRVADISVGDFWKVCTSLDDDLGTSLLMINSAKGRKALEGIRDNLYIFAQNYDEIFDGNHCINNSVKINPRSKSFLLALDKMSFSQAVKRYSKKSIISKIRSKISRIISNCRRKNENK